MNQLSLSSSKGHILKTMMRHPETAKLIRDALVSPVGSTSRQRTKKLLSIMNKLHEKNNSDGAGGPEMMYDRMNQQPAQTQEQGQSYYSPAPSKGMVIFHRIPKPKITYGKKASKAQPQSRSFDGSGGPGIYDGAGGWFTDAVTGVRSFFNGGTTPTPQSPQSFQTTAPMFNSQNMSLFGSSSTSALPPSKQYGTSLLPAPYAKQDPAVPTSPVFLGPQREPPQTPHIYSPTKPLIAKGLDYVTGAPSMTKQNPGYIAQGLDFITKKAYPSVGLAIGQGVSTAAGVQEYGARTGGNILKKIFVSDDGSSVFPRWDDMQGAKASKYLGGLYPKREIKTPGINPDEIGSSIGREKELGDMVRAMDPKANVSTTTNVGQSTPPGYVLDGKTGKIMNIVTHQELNPSTDTITKETGSNRGSQTPNISGTTATAGTTETAGMTSNPGTAATNAAIKLGFDPVTASSTPLKLVLATVPLATLVETIIGTEGSSPQGVYNNPGNIKFVGQQDAVDSGVKATDGGTYATFNTLDAGKAAIGGLITRAANGEMPSLYGTNPTFASFLNKYSNTAPTTGTSGSIAGVTSPTGDVNLGSMQAVIDDPNMSAKLYSEKMMLANGGKTYGQLLEDNYNKANKMFRVDALQGEYDALKKESVTLPADEVAYIKERDTALKNIDSQMDAFILKNITNGNMSDPSHANMVEATLKGMYIARGRVNSNYVGYVNNKINQHQQQLSEVAYSLKNAIDQANAMETRAGAGTLAEYNNRAAGYEEIYNKAFNARAVAAQLSILQSNAFKSASDSVTDPLNQQTIIDVSKARPFIEGIIIDKDGFPLDTDINEAINTIGSTSPSVNPMTAYLAYSSAVKYALSKTASKDDTPKAGEITFPQQISIAESAMKNFYKIAQSHMNYPSQYSDGTPVPSNVVKANQTMGNAALQEAFYARDTYASLTKGRYVQLAPQITEAISSLAGKGFFGGESAPLTLYQFRKVMADKTKDLKSNLYADAIFKQYNDNVSAPVSGAKPTRDEAISAILNVNDASGKIAVRTPEELSAVIAKMVAISLMEEMMSYQNQ